MHQLWTIRRLSSAFWLMAVCWLQMLRDSCQDGTTPFIKDIFIGRCWDYQIHINPQPFIHRRRNCTDLWDVFRNAFVYRTACDTELERYDAFTAAAWHSIPRDKAMFWSGVYPFIYDYTRSGKRYYAIGDTLIGYILDSVRWCSQPQSPGMNFKECPAWGSCNNTAEWSFWKAASVAFAVEAHGTAKVMFNGSSPRDPFRANSVFAQYELPQLQRDRVSHLHVVLVKNLATHYQTNCLHPSLLELRYIMESRNIEFTCVVNPPDVLYLLCSQTPEAEACRALGVGDVYVAAATRSQDAYLSWTAMVALVYISYRML